MSKNQKTRNNIKKAFLDLIKDEDFESINTKDIMDIAGGARSNFYNYFSDKFELCKAIMQDELKQMERLINAFFRERNNDLSPENIYALNLSRFQRVYENRDLYKALFSAECFRDFPEMLRRSQNRITEYTENLTIKDLFVRRHRRQVF